MENPNPDLHFVDIALIITYFVIMLTIGIYFYHKSKNIREYFGGGGQVPWWLSGFSFYMTTVSAFAFVIYSQLAYKHGWTAITVSWMATLGAILSARLFASKWRRAAKTSALDFVEERYGILMRQGLVWLNIPLRTIDNGLKLFVIGTMVSGVAGYGEEYVLSGILISGIIVIFYTVLGGLWAVVVADFVQAIMKIVAVVVLLPLALFHVGGMGRLVAEAPPGFFSLTNEKFTLGYLAAWVVLLALNYSSSWALVQRYYSVKTDKDARKVGYLVAFLHFVITPMMFIPAMAARIMYPDLTETQSEQVFAMLCRNLLPVGMIGMLISAMFAATMSMISGEYNAIASVMTSDVYRRLIEPSATPKKLILVARVTTLVIGACCIGVALIIYANPEGRNLFDIMVKIFSIFLPPIAIPMLTGLVSRKVSNAAGLLGLGIGMAAGLTGFFLSMNFETFIFFKEDKFMIPFTIGASFLGILIGTYLTPSSPSEQERIDRFFTNMASPNLQEKEEEKTGGSGDRQSSLPIIGMSIALLGFVLALLTYTTTTSKDRWISITVGVLMTLFGLILWIWDLAIRHRKPSKTIGAE